MKNEVIAFKNLPSRLPVIQSIVFWLLLDRVQPPRWCWGVIGTVLAFIWVVCLVGFFKQKEVDILKN